MRRNYFSAFLDRDLPAEEVSDEPSHLRAIRLERKVTRMMRRQRD